MPLRSGTMAEVFIDLQDDVLVAAVLRSKLLQRRRAGLVFFLVTLVRILEPPVMVARKGVEVFQHPNHRATPASHPCKEIRHEAAEVPGSEAAVGEADAIDPVRVDVV